MTLDHPSSQSENHTPSHLDQPNLSQTVLPESSPPADKLGNQIPPETLAEAVKLEPVLQLEQLSQYASSLGQRVNNRLIQKPTTSHNLVSDNICLNQSNSTLPVQSIPRVMQAQLDTHLLQTLSSDASQVEYANGNGIFAYPDQNEWNLYP